MTYALFVPTGDDRFMPTDLARGPWSDLTVSLHRQAAGDWVCLDATSHLEPEGVGLAESELWDEHGRIGRSLQSLLVERRAP